MRIKGLLSHPNAYYENFIKNNSSDLIRRGFYSKSDLEKSYKKLISHLRGLGYLQSKIYSDRVFFKKGKAFITLHLEEGPLTVIQDIKIQNAQALPLWEILSRIQSRIQSTLKIGVLQEDLERIEQLYKEKGYIDMRIINKDNVVQYTPGGNSASILIQIEEGDQARISEISIKGLKKSKENMVRSLLKFKAGGLLTPDKKEKSLKALGAAGLWTDVGFNKKKDGNQTAVELIFEERKPRSLRGGLGIHSQRGISARAYTEAAHRNLFGWGRSLTAKAGGQASLADGKTFLEYEVSGRYKEVFIPGRGFQGDISLSQSQDVFSYSKSNINFVKKNQVSFFINKSLGEHLKIGWNVLSFEDRREFCSEDQNCPENPLRIGSSSLSLVWDSRNNIFDPSRGSLSLWQTELAAPFLGSSFDIAFVKTDIHSQWYMSFKEDYIWHLALKGGFIQDLQDSRRLPVSRAFILGGRNSIRGYDGNIEGERIPNESIAPITTANESLKLRQEGALENVLKSYYGLMNLDFRFPVFDNLKGVLFYDFGFVNLKSASKELFSFGHSAGLGFRYKVFIIPFGLDIAYKLPPKKGSDYRFHFSIGW